MGVERRDATGLPPLVDDDFWPAIDVLGGRYQLKTLAAAERALRTLTDEQLLRWEETAALKALDLAEEIDFGRDALWAYGAVIGKGEDMYRAVLADPTRYEPRWLNDNSAQVLWLASGALSRRGTKVFITTSFTPTQLRLVREMSPDERRPEQS